MVYPTASEDANEELLAWEPHDDDLEFDDDFQLARRQRSRSIVTDVLADGQQRRPKLKFVSPSFCFIIFVVLSKASIVMRFDTGQLNKTLKK